MVERMVVLSVDQSEQSMVGPTVETKVEKSVVKLVVQMVDWKEFRWAGLKDNWRVALWADLSAGWRAER